MTPDEAVELRAKWIETFREMKYHMNPEPADNVDNIKKAFGIKKAEEEAAEERDAKDEENNDDNKDKRKYKAQIITGMKRNNSSFCAALNIHFQGVVACGAKLGMWNVVKLGLAQSLVNMIHKH